MLRVYREDDTPLYVQAADALRARILAGEFRPGDKLPSVRRLSDELGVNPATVVAAYRILTSEGLAEARAGSGAYVPEGLVLPAAGIEARAGRAPRMPVGPDGLVPPRRDGAGSAPDGRRGGAFDLSRNAPPRELYPLAELKRFIVEAIDADGGEAFDYQEAGGYAPLRAAIAARISTEGGGRPVDPADLHIVSGAQQGLDLAARVLLRRGDVAAVEDPGYRGAADAFVAAGARVHGLPLDGEGLELGALERLAATRPLRLVHLSPACQNPTGIRYSEARRAALAALAERYGFYISEDDAFGDLAGPDAPRPVRAFDSAGRVILIKSFSKSVLPGLRIAGMEVPHALRERFEDSKRSVDLSSSGLMQRALERFLSSGSYDRHLATARARYRAAYARFARRLRPLKALGFDWDEPALGLFLWLALPAGYGSAAFAATLAERGVIVAPASAFRLPAAGDDAGGGGRSGRERLRISFGALAEDELDAAADALVAAAEGPERG